MAKKQTKAKDPVLEALGLDEDVDNVACMHCGGSDAECLMCLGGGNCGAHTTLDECREYEGESADEVTVDDILALIVREKGGTYRIEGDTSILDGVAVGKDEADEGGEELSPCCKAPVRYVHEDQKDCEEGGCLTESGETCSLRVCTECGSDVDDETPGGK